MDFSLSEAQAELAGLTRKILADRDAAGPDPGTAAAGSRLWADLAAAGVLAAGLPEDLGGAGLDFLAQCSVLAELGRAASAAPYLASVVLGAGAIASFGSDAQRRRWCAAAGDGSVVLTVALAEEDGADPADPACAAERDGDGWRVSGVKTVVPAATRADVLLVPVAGPDGVLVFLVEPGDDGVTVQPQALTGDVPAAGGRAAAGGFAGAGRVVLDGVPADTGRLLGGASDGRAIARWLAARGTVGVCATQAGVLERALELTAEYARGREQFGRPIGSFQAVAQRLADAYVDVEAVRLTMWQAAWLLASGRPAGDPEVDAAIATAKFWAADAGHRVAHTAVHVHGGAGIDVSYPLHRYFAAATRAEFALGGATAQLLRLGDVLARSIPGC